VKDADKNAGYETAKHVVDRAQEVADLKYKEERMASEKAKKFEDKSEIATAAYEQARAVSTKAEKLLVQAEDHAFEADKPSGEPDGREALAHHIPKPTYGTKH